MSVTLIHEATYLNPRLNRRTRGLEMSVTLLYEVTPLHRRLDSRPEAEK
jgi:hypothetical protein